MHFDDFLQTLVTGNVLSTEDVLGCFLPLVRETLEAHRSGMVAPLEGVEALSVAQGRLWFEHARRQAPKSEIAKLLQVEPHGKLGLDVVAHGQREIDLNLGEQKYTRGDIGQRSEAIERPVYLAGYVSWEHELGHHDPLTDVFSLGMILASVATRLDFKVPESLERFVASRRNLFELEPKLHPVLAQMIHRMTELERHRRIQDLQAVLTALENYRDQAVDLETELASLPGLTSRDPRSRQEAILMRLRDRLFDLSRRNTMLHFRATGQTLNLTHASVPLTVNLNAVRQDQILVWNEGLRNQIVAGQLIRLNKYLNFNDAIYLPSLLDRIIGEARRDQNEFGCAQLRLVICSLAWANLKVRPIESYVSPLVLVSVRVAKQKGIRDTYSMEALTGEAEINPVVRHMFRQLYDLQLPETLDLATGDLDVLFETLATKIRASEPAVTLARIDRPRVELLHEKAKYRLDQYRRAARVAGRGVKRFLDLDYSYDAANYHPLGIKLFAQRIKPPVPKLREIIEKQPRPRSAVAPDASADVVEAKKTFVQLRDAAEQNPYLWNFDQCNLTLANFHYRRMSLVRDYDTLIQQGKVSHAFEDTFSASARDIRLDLPQAPALEARFDIVACDPTQVIAIAEARSGKSYIIQGPPGTGKSQTITNLIADFVARGKRVLFVCEKRAAIDVVYARLRQCGLESLCCLVHDSQTDKKEFIADLKQSYEQTTESRSESTQKHNPQRATLEALKKTLAPLQEFEAQMERPLTASGMTVRQFLDRCLQQRADLPSLSAAAADRLPKIVDWESHEPYLRELNDRIARIQPHSILARHPLRRLSPPVLDQSQPIKYLTEFAREALESSQRLQTGLDACEFISSSANSLERVEQLLEYLRAIRPLSVGGNLELLDAKSNRTSEFAAAVRKRKRLQGVLLKTQSHTSHWREKLSPADTEAALAQARQLEGKVVRWLLPNWWRLRRVLRTRYDFSKHAVRPSWVSILSELSAEHAARGKVDLHDREIVDEMQLSQSLGETSSLISSLSPLVASLPGWLGDVHATLSKSTGAAAIASTLLALGSSVEALVAKLDNFLVDFRTMSLVALRAELDGMLANASDVGRMAGVMNLLAPLPEQTSAAIRTVDLSIECIQAAVYHRQWATLLNENRKLEDFREPTRARLVEALQTAHEEWLKANAREICQRVKGRLQANLRISGTPASELTADLKEFKRRYNLGRKALEHEFGKTMRYRSIRDLVDGDTGLVVRDLKPIWMMSPLSVSDTLPLTDDFVDVVIFDEASQVRLEESVPSLFRSAQVIVVGDEMQLPPTDFFATRRNENEESEFVDDEEDLERCDLTGDSFLNHAAKTLSSTMLGWHYRSRSESLISFSNWAFYDGRLLTVPEYRLSSDQANGTRANETQAEPPTSGGMRLLASPLSFHHLSDGLYENRRNAPEANYIASMVRELIVKQPGYSIGVIAFSEAQQSEIENALNNLANDDAEFRARYEEELQREIDGQFAGLLVKNLENIQGDERDVIVLSVCYGPNRQGKTVMNFGPINRGGGEKRLNVAFSRAKKFMAVVSSIAYSQITNDYNAGAACLKSYLQYAECVSNGDTHRARRLLSQVARWREQASTAVEELGPLGLQIMEQFRKRGFTIEPNVGQSHFRVDLAVARPGDSTYCLGILLDSVEGYAHSEPLERDMLRPRLLGDFGWKIARVLAKDWYEDAAAEMQRLLTTIELLN